MVEHSVRMAWGVKIPLRDDTKLSATVYLPSDHAAACPAIVTLTPYIAQSLHDQGVYFAARGYVFIAVDVRGRGNSQGEFEPLINEAADAYDVVEWLARQPYCNGRVAMWGGSYSGYVQWAAIKELPPHLTTIVPVGAPYVGIDFPIRSNLAASYLVQWLTLVSGRAAQETIFTDVSFWKSRFSQWLQSGRPFNQLDSFVGHPAEVFQQWISHPHQGPYWDRYNPSAAQYSTLPIPVLTITGIYDADQPGSLMHYQEHLRSNPGAIHYLIIGPWDHAGTRTPKQAFGGLKVGSASLLDLPNLHLQWYRWVMSAGPKPDFLRDKVAYYLMGADEWRYAASLADVTAKSVPFYLQSKVNPRDVFQSGSLSLRLQEDGGGPDSYVYDPKDVRHIPLESQIEWGSKVDQRLIYGSKGAQLIYHSALFSHDTDICGFFRFSAWISIDQPDTDLRVSVHEIGLDGSSVLLALDSMRARYRQNAREAALIHTTDPLLYEFKHFTFTARRVCKGSRLRLVVGPINSIFSQKNYNSGGEVAAESVEDSRTVTVRLFHDEIRPSILYVPFAPELEY